MKNQAIRTRFMLPLLALGVVAVSCDKNDDNNGPAHTDKSVLGSYAGSASMLYTTPSSNSEADSEKIAVEARVDADSLRFDEFPVAPIIELILGEEDAAAIIEQIGTVSYKVLYTATPSENAETSALEIVPEPLKITLPAADEQSEAVEIAVTISAPEAGLYTCATRKMAFTLTVDEVTLAGTPIDVLPENFNLKFDLNKN